MSALKTLDECFESVAIKEEDIPDKIEGSFIHDAVLEKGGQWLGLPPVNKDFGPNLTFINLLGSFSIQITEKNKLIVSLLYRTEPRTLLSVLKTMLEIPDNTISTSILVTEEEAVWIFNNALKTVDELIGEGGPLEPYAFSLNEAFITRHRQYRQYSLSVLEKLLQ